MIAASVIPLVIDTGRVLSLDMGGRDDEVRQALSEVLRLPLDSTHESDHSPDSLPM